MVPSCPRPGRRPSRALGAGVLGVRCGATVAALSSGAKVATLSSGAIVSGFLKSSTLEGFAWTKALLTLNMSCSEGSEPEGPESQS